MSDIHKETNRIRGGAGQTAAAKKAYSAPRLVVYGDLRAITETMRRSGADGGSGGNQFSK